MKKALVWIGYTFLVMFALLELLAAISSPMPNALAPLAIGGGILFWLAVRFQRKSRSRDPIDKR
jgi:hypothetical protein